MKPVIKWTSFAIAAYAVALIVTTPAGIAWQIAGSGLPVRLVGPTGTLFSGSAQAIAWPDGARIDALQWAFQPGGLVTGAAAMRIEGQLRGDAIAGTIRYRPWRGVQVRNAQLDAPVDQLLAALRHQSVAEMVNGRLGVDLEQVTMAGERLTAASGVVRWRNAGVDLGSGLRFGELTLRLEPAGNGEGATGKISSRGGDIDLSGELRLRSNRDFELKTRIGDDGPPNDATRRLLALLGLSGDGNRRLEVTGNWRNNQLALEQVERN